jgi:MFS family permease
MIFPSTLSLISNPFVERRERAVAIGLWGATAGLGVAFGPITGGLLLEHFNWSSIFFALAPVAAVTAVVVALVVQSSRDPSAPPPDLPGLALATGGMALLIYTVIEAPARGWGSWRTVTGFVVAGALLVAFVGWERRAIHPTIDVGLFRNLRFTAASGSATIAFYALSGFIFLVTQYFQFLKGYSPLSTGVRLLPVATSVAVTSVLGTRLAVRIGTKVVVATGLLSLAAAKGPASMPRSTCRAPSARPSAAHEQFAVAVDRRRPHAGVPQAACSPRSNASFHGDTRVEPSQTITRSTAPKLKAHSGLPERRGRSIR